MVVYAFIANGGLGQSSEKRVSDLTPYSKAKRSAPRRQLPQRLRPCNLNRVRFDPDNEDLIESNGVFDQDVFLNGLLSYAWHEALANKGAASWQPYRHPIRYF
jgi:hypothetical protein